MSMAERLARAFRPVPSGGKIAGDDEAECTVLALEALLELNALLGQRVEEASARALESSHQLMRRASDAVMGEMIGNIAHQWRQPLTGLSLILQNIRHDSRDGRLDPALLARHIERAQMAIEQMSTTIEDFRQFFSRRPSSGAFGLRAATRQCGTLVEATLRAHGIDWRLSGEEIYVHGRQSEFLQVLLNLLVNAKEALVERRVAGPWIEVRIEGTPGRAVLTVADNAGGIAPEILGRIFDPYFTTKPAGSGIGLYMSRNLVEQHFKGAIHVDNDRQGACFRLTLPTVGAPPGEVLHAQRQIVEH